MHKEISILGVKMDLGRTPRGADHAPESIRKSGLIQDIKLLIGSSKDLGDIASKVSDQLNTNKNLSIDINDVASDFERIASAVSKIIDAKSFPLVLGGDHSISIGTIAGIAKHYKNLGVIWYDAHADVNTHKTSITGNIYGMPLAVNLGFGYPKLVNIGGYMPKVRFENVVLIGNRELDDAEKKFLINHRLKVFSVEDVRELGIAKVLEESLRYLKASCDGIHLSFDFDAIDPQDAPGVRTPSKSGLSYAESVLALKSFADSNLITSAEFVELNPTLDNEHKTAKIAVELVKSLLVCSRRG